MGVCDETIGGCLVFFPTCFVTGLWVWSYYVYVTVLMYRVVDNLFVQFIFGIFYHILSILMMWSYFKAVFTRALPIPEKFEISDEELEQLQNMEPCPTVEARNLPLRTHDGSSNVRFCPHCRVIKPDRCRHCRICSKCILKYDHHCPWVANCVGFHNYKFFVLFVVYATLFNLYVCSSSARYFISFLQGNLSSSVGLSISAICVVSGLMFITIMGLSFLHLRLVSQNKTTVEDMRDVNILVKGASFSLGGRRNFYEIFGFNWKLWPFPVSSSLGDGCDFPLGDEAHDASIGIHRDAHDLFNLRSASNSVSENDHEDAGENGYPAHEVLKLEDANGDEQVEDDDDDVHSQCDDKPLLQKLSA
eukprot:m.32356 g.32356  ORF g.32356 m.32356 type:complete len:361 (+) comp6379_c0_seq1:61-1143(+)